MTGFNELLNFNNEVFKSYAFWSGVLVLKMLGMSFLTGMQRFRKKVFSNSEDLVLSKKPGQTQQPKIKFDDQDVERVRRAHLNDLENILPFFVIGFFFVLTNPDVNLAINIFRAFAVARIAHTLVYAVVVVPQPARALAFFVGVGCTVYMAVQTLIFFL